MYGRSTAAPQLARTLTISSVCFFFGFCRSRHELYFVAFKYFCTLFNTFAYIANVTFPVDVFCWLG